LDQDQQEQDLTQQVLLVLLVPVAVAVLEPLEQQVILTELVHLVMALLVALVVLLDLAAPLELALLLENMEISPVLDQAQLDQVQVATLAEQDPLVPVQQQAVMVQHKAVLAQHKAVLAQLRAVLVMVPQAPQVLQALVPQVALVAMVPQVTQVLQMLEPQAALLVMANRLRQEVLDLVLEPLTKLQVVLGSRRIEA